MTKRARYSEAFKRRAVELYKTTERTQAEVGDRAVAWLYQRLDATVGRAGRSRG